MWSKIIVSFGALFHWITGWIVHPEKGGCSCESDQEVFDKVNDLFSNEEKER